MPVLYELMRHNTVIINVLHLINLVVFRDPA
jgi:hypothetical protein